MTGLPTMSLLGRLDPSPLFPTRIVPNSSQDLVFCHLPSVTISIPEMQSTRLGPSGPCVAGVCLSGFIQDSSPWSPPCSRSGPCAVLCSHHAASHLWASEHTEVHTAPKWADEAHPSLGASSSLPPMPHLVHFHLFLPNPAWLFHPTVSQVRPSLSWSLSLCE